MDGLIVTDKLIMVC